MDEDFGYEYDEGSDIDNWEDEQVFQDREWEGGDEDLPEPLDYDEDEADSYAFDD